MCKPMVRDIWANRVMRVREFGMTGRGLVGWDWAVALVVALVQVAGGRAANLEQTDVRSLDTVGYALLVAGPLLLVLRRYQPLAVLGGSIGICVAYLYLGYGYGPIFLSLVIAFLTAAITGSRWLTYPLVPVGYLLLVWPLPPLLGKPTEVWQVFGLLAWLTVLLAAAEGIRQRRTVLAERAQRAEATRRDELAQRQRRAMQERLATARELHDGLAHRLSLITVQASMALELFDSKPEQAATALGTIKDTSKEALGEVHTLLHTIRSGGTGDESEDAAAPGTAVPTGKAGRKRARRGIRARRGRNVIDAVGLRTDDGATPSYRPQAADGADAHNRAGTADTAGEPSMAASDEPVAHGERAAAPRNPAPSLADLDELLHRTRETGLTVHTRVLGNTEPLPSVIDVAAARIIQESLTNVIQHAPGADATVTVRYTPESVDFTIDNSRPTATAARSGTHLGNGILGMRERAHALGGALTAGPRPSGGFRVAARLPNKPPAAPLADQEEQADPGRTAIAPDQGSVRAQHTGSAPTGRDKTATSDNSRSASASRGSTRGPGATDTGNAIDSDTDGQAGGSPGGNTRSGAALR